MEVGTGKRFAALWPGSGLWASVASALGLCGTQSPSCPGPPSHPTAGGKFGEEVGFILQGIRVLLLEILLPLKGCRGFVDQVDICIGN